jgi:hypothetical protein
VLVEQLKVEMARGVEMADSLVVSVGVGVLSPQVLVGLADSAAAAGKPPRRVVLVALAVAAAGPQ